MNTKNIEIQIPAGYELDKEQSTSRKLVFKRVFKRVKHFEDLIEVGGYWVDQNSCVMNFIGGSASPQNKNICYTEKQALSQLAFSQLSQLLPTYCEPFTDEEWVDSGLEKFCIERCEGKLIETSYRHIYYFLAFRTIEQRVAFLKDHRELIEEYFML